VAAQRKSKPKVGLPVRSPICRSWWFLNINFASDAVLKHLVDSGMVVEGDPRQCLNNDIVPIVEDYISQRHVDRDPRNRVTQKQGHEAAARLERTLARLIGLLAEGAEATAIDRILIEALRVELDRMNIDEAPDPQYIRSGLEALREAAQQVRNAELGAGRPVDRNRLCLVFGLANIFKERTGHISRSPNGRFAKFVEIINELIPEEFQFIDADGEFDALIANAVAMASNNTA
jgi:hypothetical protein